MSSIAPNPQRWPFVLEVDQATDYLIRELKTKGTQETVVPFFIGFCSIDL